LKNKPSVSKCKLKKKPEVSLPGREAIKSREVCCPGQEIIEVQRI
jgi:hypothetical protein